MIDSYSYDQINLNHSFKIKQKNYSIDSINNLIIIEKPFGRKLTISSNEYDLFQGKIDFKTNREDTIKIQLKPNQMSIIKRYNDIWSKNIQQMDTIILDNRHSLSKKVLSYLNYLSATNENCDNGTCSYSNTYRYQINFVKTGSVYLIEKIEKLHPREYNCDELDQHLKQLSKIFPKFILKEEVGNLNLQFTIML